MKWKRKYKVDLEEVHNRNLKGASLAILSKEYNIPKTTLNRYLTEKGYKIQMNRKTDKRPYFISKEKGINHEYNANNSFAWKQALIYHFGYKCAVCGYDKIVEAHHILPVNRNGKDTIKNGILLCPNHHAEVHAGLLDLTKALIKLSELLGNLYEGNQQPSHIGKLKQPRDMEGPTTTSQAEAVIEARALKSNNSRLAKNQYLKKANTYLLDMI